MNFDTLPAGTHVTDQYKTDTDLFFQAADDGWVPRVENVGPVAQSQPNVGDMLNCAPYIPTAPEPCGGELVTSGTTGRFVNSVMSVSVYVGFRTAPGNPGEQPPVTLQAYDTGGLPIGTPDTKNIASAADVKTLLTVDMGMPTIGSFGVSTTGSPTAPIAVDTISFEPPPSPAPPDFSLTADLGTATVRQGTSVDVPIQINRVNGSTGDITFAASGLPAGVTASFIPNPATAAATTLRLTASDTAPVAAAGESFPEFTVTATPAASAGSEPRSFKKTLRVERNFTVEVAGGASVVALPSCLELQVPVLIRRGGSFTGSVNLAASFPGGNGGITATFEPGTVGPGDGNASMRLHVPASNFLSDRDVTVTGSSAGVPSASDSVTIDRVPQTVAATTARGLTPRRGGGGTEITLTGGGFCSGSKVQFGNDAADDADRAAHGPLLVADGTDISAGGSQMKARVPRLGTTGRIRVIQPGGPIVVSAADFTVDSYRSRQGFAFDNFGWGNFSFGEMTDLYGIDEMFVHVNLCWPWGSCPVPSGVPDPLAYIAWQAIEQMLQSSGGHCFGIAWTLQQLEAGDLRYSRFTGGATSPFELADHTGPKNGLGSYLDAAHGGQTSAEFLDFFFDRSDSLGAQLQTIRSELSKGRQPAVSIRPNLTKGHVMTAYDTEAAPDGGAYIYVYDNNRPFVPRDTGPDGTGTDRNELKTVDTHHSYEIANGRIHVNAARTSWTFPDLGWSGGGDDLFAIPYGVIPGNPTLPLSLDPTTWLNLIVVFGASDGAAASGGIGGARAARFLPALDSAATPGSGTHVVRAKGPIVHRIDGLDRGRYRDAFLVPGFAASLHDVRTRKGIDDDVRYDPDARGMSFAGELDRPLQARLGVRAKGGDTHTAEIRTNASRDGRDGFRLGRRARQLVYTHDGPATGFSVALGRVGRNGMPARFESGPLRIRRGERAVLKPVSWRRLDRVRLTVTGPNGRRTRILRDRSRFAGRLAIRRLKVGGSGRRRQTLSMRARFGRVPDNATALAAFRVMKRGRTVGRRAVAIRHVRRGKRRFQERLRLPAGRYRLRGYLTLTRPGVAADSRTRTRTVRFRVGR